MLNASTRTSWRRPAKRRRVIDKLQDLRLVRHRISGSGGRALRLPWRALAAYPHRQSARQKIRGYIERNRRLTK
jgi:hypothetical protein